MKIKRFLNRKGFTLAEMLIVVAILVIIMAVAVPNVAKYVKTIKLRELDDSALSIYMAAEHELKSDIEMGRDIAKDNELDVPDRYTDGGTTSVDKINYLVYYGTVPSGGIISTSAIEPELAANNYVIEFNAETGDVYGVFYSTEPTEFNDYKEKYNDDSGKYAKAVNKTADRVGTLGYYGLENVSVSAPPKPEEIPVPEVRVINAEKLVLRITAPNFSNKENKAYIAIDICDADDNDKIVHLVPHDGSHYMSSSGTADIILDSLEPNGHAISNELAGIAYEEKFSSWADGIITPGEDLNIKVTFYDPKGVAIDQTKTVRANSLFADGSSPETANIEYGRHLQNLGECDTIQTVDIIKTIDFKAPGDKEKIKNTTAEQDGYKHWSIVYKTTGDNFGGYTEKLFHAVTTYATKISAKSGVQIRHLNAEEGIFSYLNGVEVTGLTIVNPLVTGYNSGAIASSAYGWGGPCIFKNCSVYVETGAGENWVNPKDDPYNKYTISGLVSAGGLVGMSADAKFENCYASVKIYSDSAAGGLIGYINDGVTVSDCYVGGHTYAGKFEGILEDGITSFDLTDNVSGTNAGGIIGYHDGNSVTFSGTVFSSCSVKGTVESDTIICSSVFSTLYENIHLSSDDNVYSLGTAYLPDGTTLNGSAINDASGKPLFKSASDFASYDKTSYGYRYDTHGDVTPVFKYPLPSGMIMHGDWPSGEPVTGFFYWEKEGENYKIHSLYYDPQNPTSDGSPKKCGILGNADDVAVSESGYGIFCIDGDVDGAKYYPSDGAAFSATPIDDISTVMKEVSDADKNDDIVNALKDALKGDDNLKITDSNFKTAIYVTGDGAKKNGNIKATLNEKSFTFAPYFYGLVGGESGFGNSDKPFEVRTAQHLDNVRYFLSMNFKQGHDLLPGAIKPIGDSTAKFEGTYNGNGFEIIDMKITVSDPNEPAGMFGTTDGATLKNIVLRASAENTNYVETSPATPTATALSALVGSPISGINETLAAVDGEGYEVDNQSNYDKNYLYKKDVGWFSSGDTLYEFNYGDANNELFKIIQAGANNSAYDVKICFDISALGLSLSDPSASLIFEAQDSSGQWETVSEAKATLIQKSGILFLNSTVYEATISASELNSYNIWGRQCRFRYEIKGSIALGTTCYLMVSHNHVFDITNDNENHYRSCNFYECGYRDHAAHSMTWEIVDNNNHNGKCTVCNHAVNYEAHQFGSDNKCEKCGYQKINNCPHLNKKWVASDRDNHKEICTDCLESFTQERHTDSGTYVQGALVHYTECSKCHYKMSKEVHKYFENSDGKQECSVCHYIMPTSAALANNVLGGLVGEAKSTAADKPTVINNCTVERYTLDPDSALVSLLPGGGPTLKFEDYHFSHFYEMIQEYGSSQNFSIVGINTTTPESIAGGYSCEMERLIKSAYNAIAAGHPEYEYRFRIQMENGDYTQGSIGNLYFYSPDAQRCPINMVKSEDVGFTVEKHDDSRKETIDGKEVTYRVRTALDLIYALEIGWPNLGYYYSDFTDFGLYIEGETSYVQGQGSINTGANDQQPSTSNSVIGGIAAKTVAKTSITECKVLNVTFGDAAIAGGIVGEASECKTAAPTISNNKALVNGFNGSINKSTRLGGILAVKDDTVNLENNKAAFKGLDPLSWQYVFAVAPDASSSNRYVKGNGYATGLHTEGNAEHATEISLEDFNNS